MYVLEPLNMSELKEIFNEDAIKIIDYFIKKSIFSQPEKMVNQGNLPIQIPKEHIEQWLAQALNAKSIWAGSYPVDLIAQDYSWWADIKMLSAKVDKIGNLTMNDSWETSLWQNFKTAGKALDQLFESKEYETIKNLWLELIDEKLKKPQIDHNIKKIYYFILLRWWNYLYILWMKVNTNLLNQVNINEARSSNDSVYLNNYIDNTFWNVKIYKAKKRMELRLHPKTRQDNWFVIPFKIQMNDSWINFIDYLESGNDILEYWKSKAEAIFN